VQAGGALPRGSAPLPSAGAAVTVADAADQGELFGAPPAAPLPPGLTFRAEFIDAAEEASLLQVIATLPLAEARYRGFTARRRVASYGTQYDFDDLRLSAGLPLPEALLPLRARAAAWIGVAPGDFTNVLVAEYRPGTPLGWHRDVPDFETVVGISLGGTARMRLRRWPAVHPKKADVQSLMLPPRSAYVLSGEARWGWQHSIAPTTELRWSVTFRTPRVK
jgi:alkylated DNA repair dioxygenase AlkB